MKPAIDLSHVAKIHPLRRNRPHSLKQLLLSAFRRKRTVESVVAADDICLSVPRGRALGVIGPNGAGKTTLLRLIAGITEPTSGVIHTEGRILPLLELGAGFHPELSGVENVYLQGALLGLSRKAVDRLLPSIIAFAELESFIHMPVRHFSSGMQMRLGFSISVHVEPDILLIDEAFSVGDLYFQRKCVEKMREFHDRGGTFLLVAHDMDLIEAVCDETIWIDRGRVVQQGAPTRVARDWRRATMRMLYPAPAPLRDAAQTASAQGGRFGKGNLTVDFLDFLGPDDTPRHCFENAGPMSIRAIYRVADPERLAADNGGEMPLLDCLLFAQSARGHGAACVSTHDMGQSIRVSPHGGELRIRVPRLDLAPGRYNATALFYSGEKNDLNAVYDMHSRVYSFSVVAPPGRRMSDIAGLEPDCSWEMTKKKN